MPKTDLHMGLGFARVVVGHKDSLQAASQGATGLGRIPQMVGGGLGLVEAKRSPHLGRVRPVQKVYQTGEHLQEILEAGSKFRGRTGS